MADNALISIAIKQRSAWMNAFLSAAGSKLARLYRIAPVS
jgi:hypothetical protein